MQTPPKRYTLFSEWIGKHRMPVALFLGSAVLISAIGLRFLAYSNDVAMMLPSDQNVQRTMRFLHESNLSQEVILSLSLTENERTTHDLFLASDNLVRSMNSPLITQATGGIEEGDAMLEMKSFLRYTPQLLAPESVADMASQVSPEGVKRRLRSLYNQLLAPGGSMATPFLRADPLGMTGGILRDVGSLFGSLGYDVKLKDGHFMSRDARHTMIILKTPVPMTDSAGSRELIDYLKGRLDTLPKGIAGSIIAGHLHTLSNEEVIKRDIKLTSLVASIAFLLLFLICFRDVRSALIFATPFAAIVISTHVSWLVFRHLSSFVVGMASVIAGISVDYGIYVYVAVRRSGNTSETLGKIVRPVVFGALTTISVFAVFSLSHVEGYRQLSLLSNLSIVLCLLFSLFVLPHFLRQKEDFIEPVALSMPDMPSANDRRWVFGWAVVVIVLAISATRTTFNEDIVQYDATHKEILAAENEFRRAWGGKTPPAILVAPGKTLADAYELNDAACRKAIQLIGKDKFTSLAAVWPSKTARRANLERWQDFWTKARETEFRQALTAYGRDYHFTQDAFQPFFDQLHNPAPLDDEPQKVGFFERMKDRFVVKTGTGFELVSFFPDDDYCLAEMARVTNELPGTFIVSQRHFARLVSQAALSELVWLSALGIGATLVLTLLLLRSVRLTVLALLPVLTGLAAIAGIMPLLGLGLNIPCIIAALIVVGIVSDYGMFVVYYCRHRYETGTYLAVSLAAITTLIGTGALLFAEHPTLFSVGATMVIGVLTGYISSLLIIPPLYRLWFDGKSKM